MNEHATALGPVEAYENLQFRNSIGVFDSAAGKIDILAFAVFSPFFNLSVISHSAGVFEP